MKHSKRRPVQGNSTVAHKTLPALLSIHRTRVKLGKAQFRLQLHALTAYNFACTCLEGRLARATRGKRTHKKPDTATAVKAAAHTLPHAAWHSRVSEGAGKLVTSRERIPPEEGHQGRSKQLLAAAAQGHAYRVQGLLRKGAEVDYLDQESGETALALACAGGHLSVVEALLSSKADCYCHDYANRSPLAKACAAGHAEITQALIEHGEADVYHVAADGRTILMDASRGGHLQCVQLLLDHGADPNAMVEATGEHALLEASEQCHPELVRLLLARGARVNRTDKAGNSALLVAARQGNAPLARLLLEHKAKFIADFLHKTTPLMAALEGGHQSVAQVLLQHGAEVPMAATTTPAALGRGTKSLRTPPVPRSLYKYWYQRHALFSRFDEGIQMDNVGWYSVTPEPIAAACAARCAGAVVVDAFAGVGGNAIQFAGRCPHVIAVEVDLKRLSLAQHNAGVYGLANKVDFVGGDFLQLAHRLQADVVFYSPPWGELHYQNTVDFDLAGNPFGLGVPFQELLDMASAVTQSGQKGGCSICYLPRNTNLPQLCGLLPTGVRCEIERNIVDGHAKAINVYLGDIFSHQDDA